MSSPQRSEDGDAEQNNRRLHKACEITLERYQAVANDTCKLMGRLRTLPVSKDKRLEIFLQKKKEDEAHQGYVKARNALLEVLDSDPEAPMRIEEIEPIPPRRTPRTGAYRRRSG